MAMQSMTHLIIGQQKHDVQDASQLQVFATGLLCTLALLASAHSRCCFAHLHKLTDCHLHDRGTRLKHCVLWQNRGSSLHAQGRGSDRTYRHIQVASQAAYTARTRQTKPQCTTCSCANDTAQGGSPEANLPARACHLTHFSYILGNKEDAD